MWAMELNTSLREPWLTTLAPVETAWILKHNHEKWNHEQPQLLCRPQNLQEQQISKVLWYLTIDLVNKPFYYI